MVRVNREVGPVPHPDIRVRLGFNKQLRIMNGNLAFKCFTDENQRLDSSVEDILSLTCVTALQPDEFRAQA